MKLDLSDPDAKLEELPLIGISNVIAMDLDYETDCVFWADIEKDIKKGESLTVNYAFAIVDGELPSRSEIQQASEMYAAMEEDGE